MGSRSERFLGPCVLAPPIAPRRSTTDEVTEGLGMSQRLGCRAAASRFSSALLVILPDPPRHWLVCAIAERRV